MVKVDLSGYKNLYLQTAKEYLNKLSVSLDQLSNNVSDKEALNNLHIASHSLKSQSQVMNYENVVEICLDIENVSSNALQGVIQLNNDAILNIQKEAGKLREMLKQVQHDN